MLLVPLINLHSSENMCTAVLNSAQTSETGLASLTQVHATLHSSDNTETPSLTSSRMSTCGYYAVPNALCTHLHIALMSLPSHHNRGSKTATRPQKKTLGNMAARLSCGYRLHLILFVFVLALPLAGIYTLLMYRPEQSVWTGTFVLLHPDLTFVMVRSQSCGGQQNLGRRRYP